MYNEVNYTRTPEYYEELQRRGRYKLIAYVIIILVITAIILGLILGIFLSPITVEGVSMTPTLIDGQLIFIQKAFYKLERGDIAVFELIGQKSKLIKRVIGLPGDKIYANSHGDGKLYVNDTAISDKYFRYAHGSIHDINITLKDGEYFMLGDNATESHDSRIFGVVNSSELIGKCVIITGNSESDK